ncbi:MAG: hypothetical protein ABIT47_04475 [Candidatus Paceibacterota bacterium]
MKINTSRVPQQGYKRGYIALISALLLSAILMVITFAANTEAFIARANLSNTEDYIQAKHYAYACGSIVLHILDQDTIRLTSTSPLSIQLNQNATCAIETGQVSGNSAQATVNARYGHAISSIYLRATRASSTDLFIPTYWSDRNPE